jgi:hypothetical protein
MVLADLLLLTCTKQGKNMKKMYYALFTACAMTSLGWGLTMGVIVLNTFKALDNTNYTAVILINLGLSAILNVISAKEEWFSVLRRYSSTVFSVEIALYLLANAVGIILNDLKTRWIIQSIFQQITSSVIEMLWEDVKTKEVGLGSELTAKKHLFETIGQSVGMISVLMMSWLDIGEIEFVAAMILMSVVAIAESIVMAYVVHKTK